MHPSVHEERSLNKQHITMILLSNIYNNKRNVYAIVVVIAVLVSCIEKCDSLCGETFSRANSLITIDGKEENYLADGCVRGKPIEKFQLLSNTKNIYPGTFSNLFRLHTIELNDAGIENVEPGFLENVPAIKVIKIERNALETIERYTFDEINLNVLDVSSNRLSRIAEYAFDNSVFEYLCLSDNNFDYINPNWFRDTQITALSMTHNKLTSLNENTFSEIKGMKSLKLNYNRIHSIASKTFSKLTDLQIVYISGNLLQNVDFEIKNSLINVDVSFNQISSLSLDDTSLWIMSIYPNPFECTCLMDFWKYADRKRVQLWNSKVLQRRWSDKYPVCVAKYKRCDGPNQDFTAVRAEYSKLVNYDLLGQPKYKKEDDFVDLGLII